MAVFLEHTVYLIASQFNWMSPVKLSPLLQCNSLTNGIPSFHRKRVACQSGRPCKGVLVDRPRTTLRAMDPICRRSFTRELTEPRISYLWIWRALFLMDMEDKLRESRGAGEVESRLVHCHKHSIEFANDREQKGFSEASAARVGAVCSSSFREQVLTRASVWLFRSKK